MGLQLRLLSRRVYPGAQCVKRFILSIKNHFYGLLILSCFDYLLYLALCINFYIFGTAPWNVCLNYKLLNRCDVITCKAQGKNMAVEKFSLHAVTLFGIWIFTFLMFFIKKNFGLVKLVKCMHLRCFGIYLLLIAWSRMHRITLSSCRTMNLHM